jgi:hypothetical protein
VVGADRAEHFSPTVHSCIFFFFGWVWSTSSSWRIEGLLSPCHQSLVRLHSGSWATTGQQQASGESTGAPRSAPASIQRRCLSNTQGYVHMQFREVFYKLLYIFSWRKLKMFQPHQLKMSIFLLTIIATKFDLTS